MTPRDRQLADMADRAEGRDHDVSVAYKDRITLSEGAFGRAWMRYNPGVKLVYIDDMEGHPRGITPKQAEVLALALQMIDGVGITMRAMAAELHMAPSTISRALTKFASWGIIGYIVGRGRLSGLVIFRRTVDDGKERFRKAAKERVWRWAQAAQRRISRLEMNVAPYFHERKVGVESDSLTTYVSSISKDATLTAQLPWTVQELREAGII